MDDFEKDHRLPSFKQLYGCDVDSFVGGLLVGSDDSAIDSTPETRITVRRLIIDVRVVDEQGEVMVEVAVEKEKGSGNRYMWNVKYAQVELLRDGSLSVYIPHIGDFRLLPRNSRAPVDRIIGEIRRRDMYRFN